MKYACLTHIGFEDILMQDIKDKYSGSNFTKLDSGVLIFENKDSKSDIGLTELQMLKLGFIKYIEINKKEIDIISAHNIQALLDAMSDVSSFKIKILRNNCFEKDGARALQGSLASIILNKTGSKVDLKNPERIVFVLASKDKLQVGLSIKGNLLDDFSKREYKLYNSGKALNPAFAYGFFKSILDDFVIKSAKKLELVVPFCNTGTVAIEAAKFLEDNSIDHSIYAYDAQSWMIKSAENNAKLAYIVDDLEFKKETVENLENYHTQEDKKADIILAQLPAPSKRVNIDGIRKVYVKFLEVSGKIVRKNGAIGIIVENSKVFKEVLDKYDGFIVKYEKSAYQGQLKHDILLLNIR